MVFLHPVIMRDDSLLANVSGSKYNYIRAKELALQDKGVALLPNEQTPLMRPLDELRELPPPFSDNPPPAVKP